MNFPRKDSPKNAAWQNNHAIVPVSGAILADDLEQRWPKAQIRVIVQQHPGGLFQYEIHWDEGPSNEELRDYVRDRFKDFPTMKAVTLIRGMATDREEGAGKKGAGKK